MELNVGELMLGAMNASTLIIVAIINANDQKKKKQDEARYRRRLMNEKLSMNVMMNSGKLGVLTARKVCGEHINGELEQAAEKAAGALEEYETFVHEELAERVSKLN